VTTAVWRELRRLYPHRSDHLTAVRAEYRRAVGERRHDSPTPREIAVASAQKVGIEHQRTCERQKTMPPGLKKATMATAGIKSRTSTSNPISANVAQPSLGTALRPTEDEGGGERAVDDCHTALGCSAVVQRE
jgi:hypothetical protein